MFSEGKLKFNVISNNHYISTGLIYLLKKINFNSRVVVIDLDSFSSLHILNEMLNEISDTDRVIGIVGGGVISQQFKNICLLYISMPVHIIENLLIQEEWNSKKSDWVSMVNEISNLTSLTRSQKKVFALIKCGFSIIDIAKILKINIKTCYTHAEKIQSTYNLNSLAALYLFTKNHPSP